MGTFTRASILASLHPSPSVGSIVKRVLEIDPEISATELTLLIRRATRKQGELAGDFSQIEVVDEELALEFARARVAKD